MKMEVDGSPKLRKIFTRLYGGTSHIFTAARTPSLGVSTNFNLARTIRHTSKLSL
jgi:hypothetical protein